MSDDTDDKPNSRQWYKLCVTLGVVGVTIGICSGLLMWVFPFFQREVWYHTENHKHTQQLGIAHERYDAEHHTMPGPFHDDDGRLTDIPPDPADRLSWRVSLLPYVEQDHLYRKFNLSEAWDSPTNAPVSATGVYTYTDYLDTYASTHTPYRVFYDNGAIFDSDPKNRVGLSNIHDGASNTLLVVESTIKVPWAQFNEHRYDPDGPLPPLGRADRGSFLAAMADGSVRVVKKSVSPNTLRATITRASGDAVGPDW